MEKLELGKIIKIGKYNCVPRKKESDGFYYLNNNDSFNENIFSQFNIRREDIKKSPRSTNNEGFPEQDTLDDLQKVYEYIMSKDPFTKTFDLSETKIWIGNNPELCKQVQEKAFALGWRWSSGKIIQYTDIESLYFSVSRYISYSSSGREYLKKHSNKEIFPSDLGIELKSVVKTYFQPIKGLYEGKNVEVIGQKSTNGHYLMLYKNGWYLDPEHAYMYNVPRNFIGEKVWSIEASEISLSIPLSISDRIEEAKRRYPPGTYVKTILNPREIKITGTHFKEMDGDILVDVDSVEGNNSSWTVYLSSSDVWADVSDNLMWADVIDKQVKCGEPSLCWEPSPGEWCVITQDTIEQGKVYKCLGPPSYGYYKFEGATHDYMTCQIRKAEQHEIPKEKPDRPKTNKPDLEALLQEAYIRYPKGTKYKTSFNSTCVVCNQDFKISPYGSDEIWAEDGKGILWEDGKWAEIVSKPVTPIESEVIPDAHFINTGLVYTDTRMCIPPSDSDLIYKEHILDDKFEI